VIPETRRQEELARLGPVKVFPEKLALRVPIFVAPTAEILFEGRPTRCRPRRRTFVVRKRDEMSVGRSEPFYVVQ
jgi:hypothetical protein